MTRAIFISLSYSNLLQLQSKDIANMAKNSAAQYKVVAVDNEDGVQWRRWRRLQQRSTALKTEARGGDAKMAFDTSGCGGDGGEGGEQR